LRLVFDDNPWDSLISFRSGIPLTLGGTLDLEFANGVDVGSQVGRTIHLFDWSRVSPSGQFVIGGPYLWDASQLYSQGDVTLKAVPEPGTLFLSAIGLGAILGRRLARRTRSI
jgi:hypothetical protein